MRRPRRPSLTAQLRAARRALADVRAALGRPAPAPAGYGDAVRALVLELEHVKGQLADQVARYADVARIFREELAAVREVERARAAAQLAEERAEWDARERELLDRDRARRGWWWWPGPGA